MIMTLKYKTVWHCTPKWNLDSILVYGVDPTKALGNIQRSWFVQWHGLPYALAHISARHGVSVNQLAVIRLKIPESRLTHHRLAMYYSYDVERRGFRVLAGDQALDRWERQRRGLGTYYGKKEMRIEL